MSTDNHAIQVVARSLTLEVVVPPQFGDNFTAEVNATEHFRVAGSETKEDGLHIKVATRVRFQGLLQQFLEETAHKLGMSFRDSTQSAQ